MRFVRAVMFERALAPFPLLFGASRHQPAGEVIMNKTDLVPRLQLGNNVQGLGTIAIHIFQLRWAGRNWPESPNCWRHWVPMRGNFRPRGGNSPWGLVRFDSELSVWWSQVLLEQKEYEGTKINSCTCLIKIVARPQIQRQIQPFIYIHWSSFSNHFPTFFPPKKALCWDPISQQDAVACRTRWPRNAGVCPHPGQSTQCSSAQCCGRPIGCLAAVMIACFWRRFSAMTPCLIFLVYGGFHQWGYPENGWFQGKSINGWVLVLQQGIFDVAVVVDKRHAQEATRPMPGTHGLGRQCQVIARFTTISVDHPLAMWQFAMEKILSF